MTVLGCDISNHQGEITVARAQGWAAAGIQHVVVRASLERQSMVDLARRQMQACKDAGLSISGYGWFYYSVDPADWARQTLNDYGDLGLVRVWLDCEETTDVSLAINNVAWIARWLETLKAAGMPTGIYTGAWWWPQYTADSHAFAAEPLWTAQYDHVMDLNLGLTYGGWTHPYAGKQYADDGMVGGMKLDLDLFSDEVVSAGEDMSQVDELMSLLGYLQGDVATALQDALDGARAAKTAAARKAAYDSLQAAISTLRRGGAAA